MERRRVLLVTHDASRTGAPMIALLLARSMVELGLAVTVVSRRSGPLMEDFAAVAPTRHEVLYRVRRRFWEMRATRPLAWPLDFVGALLTLALHRPDIVYLNSTAAAIYVPAARWLRTTTVLHVHESDANTEMFLGQARARDLAGAHLVACSPTIHRDLARRAGRAASEVHLLRSVPDDRRVRALAGDDAVRTAAGDPGRAGLVVGATGSVGHRKGTDLWVMVAEAALLSSEPGTTFRWVGDLGDPSMARAAPGVEFTGARSNPYALMSGFDVATLPSRDDPYPLVVVESMLLGKPVVAFDVGDVREQVGDGGLVVPAEDVAAFTDAVRLLLVDAGLRRSMGEAARRRADDLFSTDRFVATLADVMAVVVGGPDQRPMTASRQAR